MVNGHVINRVIYSVHLERIVYSHLAISMLCHGFVYALVCKHCQKSYSENENWHIHGILKYRTQSK